MPIDKKTNLESLSKFIKSYREWNKFHEGSIISKELNLPYVAVSSGNFVNFNCKKDDSYSFRIHELEFRDDKIYWMMHAQRDNELIFKGFANRLYDIRIGSLRGVLESPKDYRHLGLIIKDKRIEELKTHEEMQNILAPIDSFAGFILDKHIQELNMKKSI